MHLGDMLRTTAARHPIKAAFIFGDREWTYTQLDRQTEQIATSLQRAGVNHGDRVGLSMKNCPELILSYYACFKLGAIAVPLNTRYKAPEVAYAIQHAGVRILIVQDELCREYGKAQIKKIERCYVVGEASAGALPLAHNFTELLEDTGHKDRLRDVREEDRAVILYTSGTTSKPKGVVHTHFSLWHTVLNQIDTMRIDAEEISLVSLAICHIAGFAGQILTTGCVGGTVILLPSFEPSSLLHTINTYRPTKIQLLPTSLADLLQHPDAATCNLSSVKCCLVGGDKVPGELHQQYRRITGGEVTETCGMTESYSYATNPPFGAKRPGSIGKPVHGTSLRLVDADGRDVPTGEVGEILVKSDANMLEYWNDAEETRRVLNDGWLRTGDLARMDTDGYYWFEGRSKEIIIRGGSNISPLEVEDVLRDHPAVKSVCVVGKPDPHVGQVPMAYVSLKQMCSLRAGQSSRHLPPRVSPLIKYLKLSSCCRNCRSTRQAKLIGSN